MQQILASFGPLQGMITPAVPSLAPITTSFTPLAPINPVALASSDTITSQSGQIDLPPAVAPSDSFTDHESELDQSPSDSISAMFNDNEEKDTTPLNEVAEHTPKKDSSIQPAQDLVAITVTQDVVTNFEEYNFTIGKPLDPPPTTARFLSMEQLVSFCQEWAKHHGYAIFKAHSNTGKNVYIKCDRSGDFRGQLINTSGRKTATIKIGCPFKITGSIPTSTKIANKTWSLKIQHGEHNHEPSACPSAHAAHKRLHPEQVVEIMNLSKSNLKPAQILLQLRTSDNETYATNKTISNVLQKQRRDELAGKTPTQVLLLILKETNWTYDVKVNSSGEILNLFFAHPGSIHLARINHHVALLDSTYKTNRYQLPLLHIIGQVATNRSFSLAFCFLAYEDQESYVWAVENLKKHVWRPQRIPKVFVTDRDTALRNALAEVFPDSQANLCTWHLNQNIATNCKTYFSSTTIPLTSPDHPWRKFLKVWGKVTSAKTPAIYVDRLNELKIHLATRPAVLEYITTSILPVKELFVVAWACQHPHLQNLHTSRAEAGHAYLKTFITNSTGDLLSVFKCLTLAVDAQLNSVHESIARDTIRTLVNVPKSFIPLLGCVSSFAIKECIEQYNRLVDLDPTEECSHTVTVGLGIPCAHKIAELLENDNQLSPVASEKTDDSELDLDHEIKMLVVALSNEKPEALPKVIQKIKQISAGTHTAVPILAPHVKSKTKGRPTTQLKKQRSTSTRRNPSAHELVDAKLKKDQMAKKRALKASGRKTVKRIKKSDEDDDIEVESDENLLDGDYEEEESDNEEDGSQSGSQCDENLVNHIDERTAGKNELGEEAAGELGLDGNLATDGDSANEGGLNHPVKPNYISQIPKHIQQHIKDVFDPTADGNCGFRCLARSLGYAEDGWRKVRKELTKEATDHKGVYLKLQGGEESMNRIIESLEESSKSPITTSQWLNKMNHGQIIANTYRRPIIFISNECSNTFLPLRLGPSVKLGCEPVYLLHVNGNHWVLANVEGKDGVKPIPPPVLASRVTSKTAKNWLSHLKEGLALYIKDFSS
ncbi:hypothetical protein PSTT_00857 [Puccinia striiformis]|uniref:MULE transposase domain-containing protein n=2 Tax=Puccinia striiformis TaxID=27350 RepID=A0A2S4W5M5_9BASI|nr:hypothetical protein PSTT_00857 [Puccinia striiformis]